VTRRQRGEIRFRPLRVRLPCSRDGKAKGQPILGELALLRLDEHRSAYEVHRNVVFVLRAQLLESGKSVVDASQTLYSSASAYQAKESVPSRAVILRRTSSRFWFIDVQSTATRTESRYPRRLVGSSSSTPMYGRLR